MMRSAAIPLPPSLLINKNAFSIFLPFKISYIALASLPQTLPAFEL